MLAFAFLAGGCGGGGEGSAPSGPAAKAAECPVQRFSSKLTRATCPSPDGDWTLKLRRGTSYGRLFLARRGETENVQMYHSSNSCCQYMAWARPHLLLFLDYPLVESLDPTIRIVTHLGSLSGMVVSPTGRWFAGTGSAGPEDPIATTVYVLAVGARKCLVVPGTSYDAAGFTRDGNAVIVQRNPSPSKPQLRQFSLSSLHTDCPQDVLTKRVTALGS